MSAHLEAPRYGADRPADLLTIAEVARLLGISRGSVYSLMRNGELSPIRVGQRARFEPRDIRAFIDRHREGDVP